MTTRRLLSIAHSYSVGLNRRLAHEMARVGAGRWEVTAAAPNFLQGDLRPIPLVVEPDEPCRVVGVPARWTKRVHIMLYSRRLRQLLKDEPWDLVHCWEEPYILAGGQVARWTPQQTPLVYYTCQNIAKRYPPPFSMIERRSLERCSAWIAMGQTVAEAQIGRGVGYERRAHRVITPGVDLNHFRPRPEGRVKVCQILGWSDPGPPVVGYLGRFVPEKGIDLIMRSLDAIDSPWRALFVGTGPMEGALRLWAERHDGRVKVATDVRHDQVSNFLNAMDLLAAPSQTKEAWREQFGRMLIEAFACGVPVVASDSGEIPHVVANAGLIVGEHDDDGWRETLAALIDSPERRAELRARGLDRVRAEFAWPVIARRHLDFFEELLDANVR
ncbi:MAG: glycosyltransferase family 4 protein [Isosphaeraceae bacterium]